MSDLKATAWGMTGGFVVTVGLLLIGAPKWIILIGCALIIILALACWRWPRFARWLYGLGRPS